MKLGKISLQNLSKAEMEKKEQNMLRGGQSCNCKCFNNCPCRYAGAQEGPNDSYYGGSSTQSNESANGTKLYSNASNNAESFGGTSYYYDYWL